MSAWDSEVDALVNELLNGSSSPLPPAAAIPSARGGGGGSSSLTPSSPPPSRDFLARLQEQRPLSPTLSQSMEKYIGLHHAQHPSASSTPPPPSSHSAASLDGMAAGFPVSVPQTTLVSTPVEHHLQQQQQQPTSVFASETDSVYQSFHQNQHRLQHLFLDQSLFFDDAAADHKATTLSDLMASQSNKPAPAPAPVAAHAKTLSRSQEQSLQQAKAHAGLDSSEAEFLDRLLGSLNSADESEQQKTLSFLKNQPKDDEQRAEPRAELTAEQESVARTASAAILSNSERPKKVYPLKSSSTTPLAIFMGSQRKTSGSASSAVFVDEFSGVRWTAEDDQTLVKAMEAFPCQWSRIALQMNARVSAFVGQQVFISFTSFDCERRWKQVFKWSTALDQELSRLAQKHACKWGFVANELKVASADMCKARYELLLKQSKHDSEDAHRPLFVSNRLVWALDFLQSKGLLASLSRIMALARELSQAKRQEHEALLALWEGSVADVSSRTGAASLKSRRQSAALANRDEWAECLRESLNKAHHYEKMFKLGFQGIAYAIKGASEFRTLRSLHNHTALAINMAKVRADKALESASAEDVPAESASAQDASAETTAPARLISLLDPDNPALLPLREAHAAMVAASAKMQAELDRELKACAPSFIIAVDLAVSSSKKVFANLLQKLFNASFFAPLEPVSSGSNAKLSLASFLAGSSAKQDEAQEQQPLQLHLPAAFRANPKGALAASGASYLGEALVNHHVSVFKMLPRKWFVPIDPCVSSFSSDADLRVGLYLQSAVTRKHPALPEPEAVLDGFLKSFPSLPNESDDRAQYLRSDIVFEVNGEKIKYSSGRLAFYNSAKLSQETSYSHSALDALSFTSRSQKIRPVSHPQFLRDSKRDIVWMRCFSESPFSASVQILLGISSADFVKYSRMDIALVQLEERLQLCSLQKGTWKPLTLFGHKGSSIDTLLTLSSNFVASQSKVLTGEQNPSLPASLPVASEEFWEGVYKRLSSLYVLQLAQSIRFTPKQSELFDTDYIASKLEEQKERLLSQLLSDDSESGQRA